MLLLTTMQDLECTDDILHLNQRPRWVCTSSYTVVYPLQVLSLVLWRGTSAEFSSLLCSTVRWVKKAKGMHTHDITSVHLRAPMCKIRVMPAERLHEGMQNVENMRRPLLVAVDDAKSYTRLINVGMMRMQNKTGYATRGNSCLKAFLCCSRPNTFSSNFLCAR